MDLRSKTIQDLLTENQQETKKWEQYREEQKTVESNLVEFQNKVEIEVLVPIGTKAFVPGVIYHTNEILVSHFQGYFSKVTTKTALEMLDHRIKLADNHLQKLEAEYKLFEPKLELPMIVKDDGQEIIEEYIEENEKQWQVKHRASVRQMKLDEKNEKSSNILKESDDVINLLEELELLEELDGELDFVQEDSNDTDQKLNQLISGELKLAPPKERKSHCQATIEKINLSLEPPASENVNSNVAMLNDANKCNEELFKGKDYIKSDLFPNSDPASVDDENGDDYDNIPLEIRILVESTKNLKINDKIKIFKKKLKLVKNSLKIMKIESEADLENKLAQLEIKETLEEIIEDFEDNEEEDAMDDETEENETEDEEIEINVALDKTEVLESPTKPQKKKYTFNEKVDICYINAKDPPRKISDDRNPNSENNGIDRPALKKVEIPLVKPKLDYDPVSTFFIRFNHEIRPPVADQSNEIVENFTKDVISSPYEVYKLVKHVTEGSFNRKGKKVAKQPKSVEVSLPSETEIISKPLKSILKPGLVLNYESFSQIDEEEIESPPLIEEKYGQSCDFSKIMGEVTEHPINVNAQQIKAMELLSQENPTKISKFKLSRKKS